MMLPKKIFKFFHLNEINGAVFSLDALEHSYVYAAPPSSFNDPFDCAVQSDLNMTPGSYKSACYFRSMPEIEIAQRLDYYFKPDGSLTEAGLTEQESWMLQIQAINNNLGVSCFSKQPYNPLMWAHYGDNHAGFCLEFECKPPFRTERLNDGKKLHKFGKVKYASKGDLPRISLTDFIRRDGRADDLILEKGKRWKYEEEYRLIVSPSSEEERRIKYAPELLTGIYYGRSINNTKRSHIQSILHNKYPHIIEYNLKLSSQYYWLEKEVIN
jgi:hypothetical protein